MNLVCLKENLKRNLDNAVRIIRHNAALPILNNFLLSAEKGMLKISSTDLEMGFTSSVPSKVFKEGKITVPAQILSQFVNNLPNKNINLEAKDLKLHLNCDNIKASINGLNAEDFPIIPKVKNDLILTINSKILMNSLENVVNSAATSDSRPEISSVYIKINPDEVKFVATDSFRLAHKTVFISHPDVKGKIKINFEKSKNIIVPARMAIELVRILGGRTGDVDVVIDENQILFDLGDSSLVSRLVIGNYPDYEAIIPKSFNTKCQINKNDLEESIKLAGCFSSKLNEVTFKTNSEKSQLEIFSNNSEHGSHNAKIDSKIEGKNVNTVFNWRYVLDGLKNISDDDLIMEFNDDARPAVIRPVKSADFFYILMPIKNS